MKKAEEAAQKVESLEKLDAAGSVTAVRRIGISVVAPATACAAGVAIARIKSSPSFTSLLAMVWQVG